MKRYKEGFKLKEEKIDKDQIINLITIINKQLKTRSKLRIKDTFKLVKDKEDGTNGFRLYVDDSKVSFDKDKKDPFFTIEMKKSLPYSTKVEPRMLYNLKNLSNFLVDIIHKFNKNWFFVEENIYKFFDNKESFQVNVYNN